VNFLIPELATNIRYSKGTYTQAKATSRRWVPCNLNYVNSLDDQIALTAGTIGVSSGCLPPRHRSRWAKVVCSAPVDLQHYDGPWSNPDDQRKIDAVCCATAAGDDYHGFSVTGMFYHGLLEQHYRPAGGAPIVRGLVDRFGSLDPSDGGQAQRGERVGAILYTGIGGGQLAANGYVINNQLTLWNNFNPLSDGPVNGDQEDQHEDRIITVGGGANFTRTMK